MELDFSRLNKLRFQMFEAAEEEPGKQQNDSQTAGKVPVNLPDPEQKEAARLPDPGHSSPDPQLNSVATAKLNQAKEDHARMQEVYRTYGENRDKANAYITQILKGVRAGEDLAGLFLTACKCISAMTGETVFYEQVEGDLKTIYGRAFKKEGALSCSLSDVQEKLCKLQEARDKETLTLDEKKRLESSIRAHRAILDSLEEDHMEASLEGMF